MVDASAFSWNGDRLAIGTLSRDPGTRRSSSWTSRAGRSARVARLPPFTGLRGIAWTPDDARLVYGLVQHESRVLLFDGLAPD